MISYQTTHSPFFSSPQLLFYLGHQVFSHPKEIPFCCFSLIKSNHGFQSFDHDDHKTSKRGMQRGGLSFSLLTINGFWNRSIHSNLLASTSTQHKNQIYISNLEPRIYIIFFREKYRKNNRKKT